MNNIHKLLLKVIIKKKIFTYLLHKIHFLNLKFPKEFNACTSDHISSLIHEYLDIFFYIGYSKLFLSFFTKHCNNT